MRVLGRVVGGLRRAVRRRRVPSVLQIEAVECGAAALAMVLAHHGRWVPLVELRHLCGVSRDGSRASSLLRAARRLGLEARGFRHEPGELAGLPMPAIVFVNMNHFMVLEGFWGGRVHLNDPAGGQLALTETEFDGIFSGVVLTFTPTDAFERSGRAPAILGPLCERLAGAGGLVALTIAAGAALVVPSVVVPGFTRIFIDETVIDGQRDWFAGLLIAIVVAALIQTALMAIRERAGLRLRNRAALAAAGGFVWRVLQLPVAFFAQRSPGSISSRTDMADRLAEHAATQMLGAVVAVISMAAFAGVMLIYSGLLTALTVATAALASALLLVLQRRIAALERRAGLDGMKLSGRTMQGLATIEVLKSNGTEDAFFETWNGLHTLLVNQRQKVGRIESIFVAGPEFLMQFGRVAVVTIAGLLVMKGELTLGMVVAFLALQLGFFTPMKAFLGQTLSLAKARATLDQFDDVLTQDPAAEFSRPPLPAAAGRSSALGRVRKLQGQVSIRELTFGYNPVDGPLIQGFSVELAPGSRVALVGGSGSGKSTVGRLVTGLLEPWSGEVLVDGQPLKELPRALLRNSMAVVDQDIAMFSGTVRDNIALWDPTMPDERIVRAAKDAMIHDDIVRRLGAYDGRVEEGGRNFSGGQRQRLEIARALVIDPSVLVLDEATSALDPLVEKAIMDNIRRRGCTAIIIAHRLSTIRDCDEIIVMDRGVVRQRGTHEAMMAVDGPYRRLIET